MAAEFIATAGKEGIGGESWGGAAAAARADSKAACCWRKLFSKEFWLCSRRKNKPSFILTVSVKKNLVFGEGGRIINSFCGFPACAALELE